MPPKLSTSAGIGDSPDAEASMSLGSLSKTLPAATLTLPTGSIDLLDTTVTREDPPMVQEDGIYKPPRTQIGPAPTKNGFLIMSNYVKVTSIPKTLWVYSLRFWRPHPQDSSRVIEFNKKREIGGAFNALLRSGVLSLTKEQKHWATNFKELWSSVRLAEHLDGEEEWGSPSFTYMQLSGKIINDMRVTIRFIKTFDDIDKSMRTEDITDLSDCIRAQNAHVSQSALAHADEGRLTQVGANKFYLNGSHEILNPKVPDGLMALRGYYTSIRPTKTGALLNINTATSAFLPPVTVSRFVKAMGNTEAERLLKGSMVRIAYRRKANDEKDMNCEEARCKVFQHFGLLAYQQRFYRVLEKDKKNKDSKRRVDPKDIGRTVAQYLTNEALVDLGPFSGDELLCVNLGKKVENLDTADPAKMRKQTLDGAVWIPACLLEILPNQAVHGLLSADNTAQMIKQAVRLPAANAGRIVQEGLEVLGVVSRFGQLKNSQLGDLGFQLDDKLISFAAKSLKMPSVWYGPPTGADGIVKHPYESGKMLEKKTVNTASWDLREIAFVRSQGMHELHVLGLNGCFQSWQAKTKVQRTEALQDLQTDLLSIINSSNMIGVPGDRQLLPGNLDDTQLDRHFENGFRWDCTLVLLQDKDLEIYSRIKRKADLQYGQHTICSNARKTENKSQAKANARSQYLANLTLKINMKMEGENHFPDRQVLDRIMGEKRHSTLILGADVTHPTVGSKLGYPSIACVVGSVKNTFMTYPGSMRLQAGGQEQIEDMCGMVKERLKEWKTTNKDRTGDILPTSILFYRDGVSESQFKICIEHEVPQIRKAYTELGGNDAELEITFIVVGKRHHTRFFATAPNQSYMYSKKTMDQNTGKPKFTKHIKGNLKPGLLVDSVVTNPEPYNFFLQSHIALQGTARPAHYHVLVDEMKLGIDIPELTLVLCTTFGRATKVVSYAAPAYIADRLCERSRVYLRPWQNGKVGPTWSSSELKHPNGTLFTKDEFKQWKKDKARALACTPAVWGNYRENGDVRLNPWHPNFDRCMFWL